MRRMTRTTGVFKHGGKERAQRLTKNVKTNPMVQLNDTGAADTAARAHWKTIATTTNATGAFKQSGKKRRMKRLSKIMKSRHSIEMTNQKDVAVKIE